jgi:hypothetical protein
MRDHNGGPLSRAALIESLKKRAMVSLLPCFAAHARLAAARIS